MPATCCIAVCALVLTTVFVVGSEAPPEARISNGLVRAKVFLPDAQSGYYRGTRFDWSGVIQDLEYAGHNFYPRWYARLDPKVVDFAYEGADIVAGRCTAITGPCEEFSTNGKPLGFDEAPVGGTFLKIGVGVLRKPDASNYSMFRVYEIVDGGKWSVRTNSDSVEFRQVVSDPTSGYGYDYRKRVTLTRGKAEMVLEHALRNTGKRVLRSSVYNHNFLFLDRQPPSPDLSIYFPFPLEAAPPLDDHLAEIQNNQLHFKQTLAGEDRVYAQLRGYGASATDYDIRVQNRTSGAGVRVTCDRPLSKLALWSIRAPMCVEPFIDLDVQPGAEFSWRIVYEYSAK